MAAHTRPVSLERSQLPCTAALRVDVCGCGAPRLSKLQQLPATSGRGAQGSGLLAAAPHGSGDTSHPSFLHTSAASFRDAAPFSGRAFFPTRC